MLKIILLPKSYYFVAQPALETFVEINPTPSEIK